MGGMVVLPVRVVWSFGHRIGDPCSPLDLSILLPDGKRRSEGKQRRSSFWGMVTYMAVEAVGLQRGAWEDAGGPCSRRPSPTALLFLQDSWPRHYPCWASRDTGIAANSVASSLMSWSAVANGACRPGAGGHAAEPG